MLVKITLKIYSITRKKTVKNIGINIGIKITAKSVHLQISKLIIGGWSSGNRYEQLIAKVVLLYSKG